MFKADIKRFEIEEILEIEKLFSKNKYFGSGDSTALDYEYIEGRIPILVSAPHAVKQEREGNIKSADIYTGSLARILNEITGCHLIYKRRTLSDPNYYKDCQYRESIRQILKQNDIKFLLDLHGISEDKTKDIDICTFYSENLCGHHKLIDVFSEQLRNIGIANIGFDSIYNTNNGEFEAIAYDISHGCYVPAIELEISAKYRNPRNGSIDDYNKIIQALSESICLVDQYFLEISGKEMMKDL